MITLEEKVTHINKFMIKVGMETQEIWEILRKITESWINFFESKKFSKIWENLLKFE